MFTELPSSMNGSLRVEASPGRYIHRGRQYGTPPSCNQPRKEVRMRWKSYIFYAESPTDPPQHLLRYPLGLIRNQQSSQMKTR